MTTADPLAFDQLSWRDPLSGLPLEPVIGARMPDGQPIWGALRVAGTSFGYPIVDCVARLTPELAERYREWLGPLGLEPPPAAGQGGMQTEATVASFGFQWAWHAEMRSEADLAWRTAARFGLDPDEFAGKLVLDAGAGAGDQSRWLLRHGAQVVSVDLSASIEVVARKLRHHRSWVGVQGDVTALPFGPAQFEIAYCEGVLHHTRDPALGVRQLLEVTRDGGLVLASHYGRSERLVGRAKQAVVGAVRQRVSRLERDKLLLVTGNLAALANVPVLGRIIRGSGLATHSALMPSFKTTWVNTFDTYGSHAYQRYAAAEEFWAYFEKGGSVELVYSNGTVVVARVTTSLPSQP